MSTRYVSRRIRPLAWVDHSRPISPTSETALLNKLQDEFFNGYLQALHEFIRQVFPYFRIPVNADPDLGPPLGDDDEFFLWAASLFQSLVIAGASLSPDESDAGKSEVEDQVKNSPLPMIGYDSAEAMLIINKLFYQVMYNQGFIDEIHFKVRIPAFRYRMKNGQSLTYSPSFPLHVFCQQLSMESGLKNTRSRLLLENYCIFNWNLSTGDLEPGLANRLSESYFSRLNQAFRKTGDKQDVESWLITIQEAMRQILPVF